MTSIVIPVFNQLHYTRQCLESLQGTLGPGDKVVIVDNGSTDGTREFLQSRPDLQVIHNDTNRGCAPAWNQGVRAIKADWTVVLNNDVLLSSDWLNGLLEFAEQQRADLVSPAIREGEMNYDFKKYSEEFIRRMSKAARYGVANGICFAVRHTVFEKVGYFDEKFLIGQFEDADFFRRAKLAGFRLGITGRSFIHHFGSITQKTIRATTPRPYEAENRAYFRKKWKLNAPTRFLLRLRTKSSQRFAQLRERWSYGHTLHERWLGGKLRYY